MFSSPLKNCPQAATTRSSSGKFVCSFSWKFGGVPEIRVIGCAGGAVSQKWPLKTVIQLVYLYTYLVQKWSITLFLTNVFVCFSVTQESELQLRRHGSRAVLVDLELPHLVRLEEDPLRTEIMLYRIMVRPLQGIEVFSFKIFVLSPCEPFSWDSAYLR